MRERFDNINDPRTGAFSPSSGRWESRGENSLRKTGAVLKFELPEKTIILGVFCQTEDEGPILGLIGRPSVRKKGG